MSIKLFDLMSGDQIGATINHPGEILSLDLNTDRKKIATASNAGTVKIWNGRYRSPNFNSWKPIIF